MKPAGILDNLGWYYVLTIPNKELNKIISYKNTGHKMSTVILKYTALNNI
jgi:hypothetical protein